MVKIVGCKFKNGGKIYYFSPNNEKYEKNMGVIVETSKGKEYATVVIPEGEVEESAIVPPLMPVVRIATQKDEEQLKKNEERRFPAMKTAQQKVDARGLQMKIIGCEFAFDGNKVVFYFSAENRVDFRELIKDLSSEFHLRIELRQVGIRDEIKLMGGIAPCGRECCCASCMPDFNKVSIKMAKNQGLSLNPGKISGLCGRLMCCLEYENDYYAEACKKVPKVGSEVGTPEGVGTVVNVNMLKMEVKVKIEQKDAVTYRDFKPEQLRFKCGGKEFEPQETEEDESDVLPDEQEPSAPAPQPTNRNKHKDKDNRHKQHKQQNAPTAQNNPQPNQGEQQPQRNHKRRNRRPKPRREGEKE